MDKMQTKKPKKRVQFKLDIDSRIKRLKLKVSSAKKELQILELKLSSLEDKKAAKNV